MKWFGVDSDTPNDPKIRALMLQGGPDRSSLHARARIGGLFLVWCHIADHGAQPGVGVDAAGRPLPLQEIADAAYFDSVDELTALLEFCASRAHIDPAQWKAGVIALPAMVKRADEYTKRLLKKQAAKNGKKTPLSRDYRENSGDSPDSPICTVVPVGVVPLPDHTQQLARSGETRARAKTGSGVMAGALPRDHVRHAYCGRVCVHESLHANFIKKLGGDLGDASVTLLAFYERTLAAIPDAQPIGDDDFDFWRKHFAAAYPSAAPMGGPRGSRGPVHTPAEPNKYAGVTLRDDDAE